MEIIIKQNDSPAVAVTQRSQERLAVFLALMAGYIDVVGYSTLKTYVSFMSGNTTQVGLNIAHGSISIASAALVAIVSFVTGIFTGYCIALGKPSASKSINVYLTAGILFTYMTTAYFVQLPLMMAIACVSIATGLMNTIVTTVGTQSVNTDFVTGTLNSFAKQLAGFCMAKNDADKKDHGTASLYLLLMWTGFLAGGVAGSISAHYINCWGYTVPVLCLSSAPFIWPNYFKRVRKKDHGD